MSAQLYRARRYLSQRYGYLVRSWFLPVRDSPKVFGIGYPKTGTKTLGECFRALGFANHTYDMQLTLAVKRGDLAPALRIARRHDSFEDWPWFLIYKDLDERFPGSKFILTRRASSEKYVSSLRRHQQREGLDSPDFQKPFWWDGVFPFERWDYARAAEDYEEHNAAVRGYFGDRPQDLKEVCWEAGDGWEEVCSFLGRPVPAAEFPHLNRAPGPSA